MSTSINQGNTKETKWIAFSCHLSSLDETRNNQHLILSALESTRREDYAYLKKGTSKVETSRIAINNKKRSSFFDQTRLYWKSNCFNSQSKFDDFSRPQSGGNPAYVNFRRWDAAHSRSLLGSSTCRMFSRITVASGDNCPTTGIWTNVGWRFDVYV